MIGPVEVLWSKAIFARLRLPRLAFDWMFKSSSGNWHKRNRIDIREISIDDELPKKTKKTLSAFDLNNRVCFQYDTTFNLTGYYVYFFMYIHPILVLSKSEKSKKNLKNHTVNFYGNFLWIFLIDSLFLCKIFLVKIPQK